MPVSTCKRILAPSLEILAMSLLHITGELMLPLLVNLLSNDVYNVLQSCLSLRMRFFIVTMLIILFIVPPVTIKEKGLLLPLFVVFKDKRLLFPLFKVFKSRPDPLIEPLIEQCTHSEFTRSDDPLRDDPDVLGILNMLHSCRDEMLQHSLVQIAQTVHTEAQVPDVEAALQSDYTTYRSRVLHRRVETGNLDLDNLSLQIAKAMRRARQIDENCTLQFGCFALLKYKDGELKWWRLREQWTPKIDEISCFPSNILDFFTGHRSQWIIRGSNLENAMLEASTANEKEEITILSRRKLDNGEDLLWCAEPGLIRRSALLFWKGVYVCALNSINDPKDGLDLDLQSESKNVTEMYWTSVAESLRPSLRTLMFTVAILLSLGISFSLGYISQGMVISLILPYWWLAAEGGRRIGFHVSGLERIPTLGEDLTNSHSSTSLPSIDRLLEDTSNNPGPGHASPAMPSQGEGDSAQVSSDGPQMRPDDSNPASMDLTLNFTPQDKASKGYTGDHETGGHNPQGRLTRKIQGKDRDPASLASTGGGGGAGPNAELGMFPYGPKHSWMKGVPLGAGSFGTVYAAVDSDGVSFAVKEVSIDKHAQYFISELMWKIERMSRYRHDNIVRYLGTEKGDDKLYIFLELVSRGSLAKACRAIKLSHSQISAYTRPILKGLEYLHDHYIVHGDIRCANILIDTKGMCKLADFGIAEELYRLGRDKDYRRSVYSWMAPEVHVHGMKELGLPADIWSLGCSIVEMATGSPPFGEMESSDVWWTVSHGNAPPIPDTLSQTAKDFVKLCLAINPAKRPTAAELLLHPFVRQDVHQLDVE